MDIPLLIGEVRRHPAIWNQKSTHYYNREVVTKSWEEVAGKCGMSPEAVKSKWKHLRDNFRKEFKKCVKDGGYQSDPDNYESGWVWFKSLNFLTDKLCTKNLNTDSKIDFLELTSQKSYSGGSTDLEFPVRKPTLGGSENSKFHSDESRQYSDNESSSSLDILAKTTKKRSLPFDGPSTKRTAFDGSSSKRRKLNGEVFDDTYHFLMSLVTPLKHLPYDRQMCVRLKMQEIISSEIVQLHSGHLPYPVELKAVNGNSSPATITPNDPTSEGGEYVI